MANGHTPASDAARAAATKKKLARFLAAFARIGSAKKACAALRMSSSTVYAARRTDPAFAAAWERIVEAQTDEVERSLYEMATGIERKIRYQGKVVGTKMEYSDYAAVKLLQARRPEVYGGGERLRGCTVAGYRRAGQRGAIVERDAPTSVHVVAEPEAAQAAIEAMQRAMLENRVEPAPPPTPLQGDVVADDAQHDAPVAEHVVADVAPDVEVLPPAPRPRVIVRVAVRQAQPAPVRVGFGWSPRRDEE